MKNNSPNKFLGGIASVATGISRGGENLSALDIAPNGKFIGFANVARAIRDGATERRMQASQAMKASQARQAAVAVGDGTWGGGDSTARVGGILGGVGAAAGNAAPMDLSLIHISEPTRPRLVSRMPSSA